MPSIYELDRPPASSQRPYARLEPGIPTGDRLRDRRDRLGPWASISPAERFQPVAPATRQIVTEEIDTPFGCAELIVDTTTSPGARRPQQTPPHSPLPSSPSTSVGGPWQHTPPGSPPPFDLEGDELDGVEEGAPWPAAPPRRAAPTRPPLAPPVTVAMEEVEETAAPPRPPQFTRRRLLGERGAARSAAPAAGAATSSSRRPLGLAAHAPPPTPRAAPPQPSAAAAADATVALGHYAQQLALDLKDVLQDSHRSRTRRDRLLPAPASSSPPPEPWPIDVVDGGDPLAAAQLRTQAQELGPKIAEMAQHWQLRGDGGPLRLIVVSRAGWREMVGELDAARADSRAHPQGHDERAWTHRLLDTVWSLVRRFVLSYFVALDYIPARDQLSAIGPNVRRLDSAQQRARLLELAAHNLCERTFVGLAEQRHLGHETLRLGYNLDNAAHQAIERITYALVDLVTQEGGQADAHGAPSPAWLRHRSEGAPTRAPSGALPSRARLRAALQCLSIPELHQVLSTPARACAFVAQVP